MKNIRCQITTNTTFVNIIFGQFTNSHINLSHAATKASAQIVMKVQFCSYFSRYNLNKFFEVNKINIARFFIKAIDKKKKQL